MDAPTSALDLSYQEMQHLLADWGEPSYRADQVWQWLYRQSVTSAEEMSNLPKGLRRRLEQRLRFQPLQVVATEYANQGATEKVLLEGTDGARIEAVLMRYNGRNTVCVSSQVGCAIGCAFCATGQAGLERDLATGEIVAQVLHFARRLQPEDAQVSNVVYMGMGEPLLNYDPMWRATMNLHHQAGMGMGTRRFTVSTIGMVPGIRRLAQEPGEVGLAISLHAPDDALRSLLVPLNRRYPIDEVLQAARYYIEETRRRVTFEYALIQGVNDSPGQARATADLLRATLCHVNLIPFNPVAGVPFVPSAADVVARFQEILRTRGIPTTVRASRGTEIAAGCGQLRATKPKRA